MESETHTYDERVIDRRLSEIRNRLEELNTLWNCACSTDVQYRMVEIEKEALVMEKTKLMEVKADLD